MATWNDFARGQARCYAKHSAVPGISDDDTEETDEDEDENVFKKGFYAKIFFHVCDKAEKTISHPIVM